MTTVDVDTRSDIYSLGVLLYELLTGSTPFDRDTLKRASFDEMRRIIREDEPPRPSSRISTLENKVASTVSDRRQIDLRHLSITMKRELDWIVMKTLEKDRNRRYESANALASDVQRYLDGEPVEACPPSAFYRFSKLARRYKGQAIAVGLGMLALIVTTLLSLMLVVRVREQAERGQQIQQEITGALTTVAQLRGQVGPNGLSMEALAQANEKIKLAQTLSETGTGDEQARAQIRKFAAELAQEQRDRKLLAALEAARHAKAFSVADDFRLNGEARIPILRAAIAAYGLPSGQGSAAEFATQIESLSPVIRENLLAALEDWHEALLPPIGIKLEQSSDDRLIIKSVTDSVRGLVSPGSQLVGVGLGHEGNILDTRDMNLTLVNELIHAESASIVRLKLLKPVTNDSQIVDIQPNPTAAWLRAVVEAADLDPWRQRFRKTSDLFDGELKQAELKNLSVKADLEEQPVSVLLRLAERLSEADSEEDARQLLKRLQQKNPSNLWVNFDLGYRMFRGKPQQTNEALRYYSVAKALCPSSPSVHLNLSPVLSGLGKFEEAIFEFREALRFGSDLATPHFNIGNSLCRLKKYEEAIVEFRECLRLRPDYAHAHSNLGVAFYHLRRFDEAIQEAREAIRLKPDAENAHSNLSGFLIDMGSFDEAITAGREAIRLKPSNAGAHENLGEALLKLNEFDEAIAEFRESLRLRPDRAEVHALLGEALLGQGKLEQAITEFRVAIRLQPELGAAHNNLGNALKDQGKLEEAIAEYREAIRLQPENGAVHSNLGNALFEQGKLDESIAESREAVRLQPDLAAAHSNLSLALQTQGKKDEAHASAIEAVRLDPKNAKFHINLGVLLMALKNEDEGVTEFREALRFQPNETRALENLAVALTNKSWFLSTDTDPTKRDPHKAVELAREAVELNPESANNFNNLGVALYRAGQWQESVDALEKADTMIAGGDRAHRMFLAMAHWQLGNQEIARLRYAEGAGSQTPFRDEAEQLMELSEVDRKELVAAQHAATDVKHTHK